MLAYVHVKTILSVLCVRSFL